MYRYETHLHTYPVSKCANSTYATVRKTLEAYKALGFTGVFITNHFLDGNVNIDKSRPYEEKINFYFSDYEAAKAMEEEIGIRVFLGVEISHGGTDFLIYGVDKQWYLDHPEVMDLDMRAKLRYYMDHGALVIHAHPFREAHYIDHIRLYPRECHGIEIENACRDELCNRMGAIYAKEYGFTIVTGGTDNHKGGQLTRFAGMETDTELTDEQDFIARLKAGTMRIFTMDTDGPMEPENA